MLNIKHYTSVVGHTLFYVYLTLYSIQDIQRFYNVQLLYKTSLKHKPYTLLNVLLQHHRRQLLRGVFF